MSFLIMPQMDLPETGSHGRQLGRSIPNRKRIAVAVFPLPNTVLFPGVLLPLHILGRKDHQVLADVVNSGLLLAVSLIVESPTAISDLACGERPVFNSICGAGSLHLGDQHSDGHTDVLIHGKRRVQLYSVIQESPFFVMEAESIEAEACLDSPSGRSMDELLLLAKAWVFLNAKVSDHFVTAMENLQSQAQLTDFFAFHFLKRAEDKQVYLNCINPIERAEMLSRYLETDLVRLNRKFERSKPLMMIH